MSQSDTHNQMPAVIRYHISYAVNDTDYLVLSFVLEDDISLRSVMDLPTLLSMGDTVDLQDGTLSWSELNFSFDLLLAP